jgi:threonine/homoserine efflux transporter RhtA
MAKYPTPVYLVAAMVAIVILGTTLDVLDATFGTQMSAHSGIWFALAAAALFIAYLVYAFKAWKKR